MLRRSLFSGILAFAFSIALSASAAEPSVFDEAWSTVKRHFYDRDLHGVDWKGMRDRYRPEFDAAETREEGYDVIRRMLGELGASHTALIDGGVFHDHFENEMSGARRRQAAIEISATDEGYFVASVLEGSKAAKAGVHKGDRVLRIDGEKPEESPLLVDAGGDTGIPGDPHFFLRLPEEGEDYELTLQADRRGESRTVSFAPTVTSMISATRQSVRVIEERGERLGYIHLWHVLHNEIANQFEKAIAGPFADCDAMVLDLRGRGGSPIVLERVLASLRKKSSWLRRGKGWRKPVVILIDENSRSAKEILAYKFKKERLGPVVGRKTPGAVLGSNFFPLKDGSMLLLPVMDATGFAGGVRLEGVGVEPTVSVDRPDRWNGGRDFILEEGVHQAIRQILAREPI